MELVWAYLIGFAVTLAILSAWDGYHGQSPKEDFGANLFGALIWPILWVYAVGYVAGKAFNRAQS